METLLVFLVAILVAVATFAITSRRYKGELADLAERLRLRDDQIRRQEAAIAALEKQIIDRKTENKTEKEDLEFQISNWKAMLEPFDGSAKANSTVMTTPSPGAATNPTKKSP